MLTQRFLKWWTANCKRISYVVLVTSTNRVVIKHMTMCRDSTWSWAWITATLINASQIAGAIRRWQAFWTAVWCRSNIIGQTWARCLIAIYLALCVWSAKWWYTWVWRNKFVFWKRKTINLKSPCTKYWFIILRCVGRCTVTHLMNGFPSNPMLQLHIGLWLLTRQLAFCPQTFGHGSTHFILVQALSREQSALEVHSGRHPGGLPK